MAHRGEHLVRRRAGVPVDGRGSAAVGAAIPAMAAEFLGRQRLILVAAADEAGAMWVSAFTGPPGFVSAPDDRTVLLERTPAPGDPLAGRFASEREVGMLAVEPHSRRRMRVNGRARDLGGRLLVRTEQVYANCPKYLQARTHLADAPAGPRDVTVSSALSAAHQRWIATADTFFVGTRAAGQGADASHRGGCPGFVTVTGPRRLTWPDYVGNGMFMTLGNLALDPRCGLLFLDWERGDALHLTGRARVDWDPARAAAVPGARRLVDLDVERVVRISGGLAARWSFGSFSRFNPRPEPAPTPASETEPTCASTLT